MSMDLYFVIGTFILAFAIPSAISAFADNRAPRVSAILIVVGGIMIYYAASKTQGGLQVDTIPNAFVSVAGKYIF